MPSYKPFTTYKGFHGIKNPLFTPQKVADLQTRKQLIKLGVIQPVKPH